MSLDIAVKRKWKDFTLDVGFRSNGEVLGILGASGCGKSMTLKCIAGIETPQEGRIAVGDRVLFDSERHINLKPQQRRVGYLFQNYALFPNMNVEKNIGCALGRVRKEDRQSKIDEILRRFRLEGLGERYPGQLSGGQQQRVALARILAYEPEVLLLDEPFSALDSYLKEQLQVELMDLLKDYAGDVVMVTHSREEVYRLCKRLLVLEHGNCIAIGDTRKMFRNPGLLTVARLTGCKNFSRAKPTGRNTIYAEDWDLHLKTARPIPSGMDYVGIRAHDFKPASESDYCVNRFPIKIREQLENQFEWNILFTKAGAVYAPSIWWKSAKNFRIQDMSIYLTVAPESVLPLCSGGQKPDNHSTTG